MTYGQLALINAENLMSIAGRFAAEGNQTMENLAHLKADQIIGQWRGSTYGRFHARWAFLCCIAHWINICKWTLFADERFEGIGGGRIPYDVNAALMPAALRSIAALARAGIYANQSDWGTLADTYAQMWEDETLRFFQVTIPMDEARDLLNSYVEESSFAGPSQASLVDSDVVFHALSLDGYDNLSQVQVMNTMIVSVFSS